MTRSKSKNLIKPFLAQFQSFSQNSGLDSLLLKAKQSFTKLVQTFIKIPILHHFDSDYYICMETDLSDYAIGKTVGICILFSPERLY